MFCAGANIYMLGTSSHAWKVNFCKFTNETRNGMEDSSRHDGLKFLAAVNGTCAGGGYELALACDEILMIDDRSTAVSLPEVPLLGVLPGTGGLTRVVDKRNVRRDLADMFCTNPDGVQRRARASSGDWSTTIAPPAKFAEAGRARAPQALVADLDARRRMRKGITLTPARAHGSTTTAITTSYVDVTFDRERAHRDAHRARARRRQPADASTRFTPPAISGGRCAMARELDDAILMLRTNELELGLLLLRPQAMPTPCSRPTPHAREPRDDWLVRETIGMLRRTLRAPRRLSRSMYALIEPRLVLRRDCSSSSRWPPTASTCWRCRTKTMRPQIALDDFNFGLLPAVNGRTRLETRFNGDARTCRGRSGDRRRAAGRRARRCGSD